MRKGDRYPSRVDQTLAGKVLTGRRQRLVAQGVVDGAAPFDSVRSLSPSGPSVKHTPPIRLRRQNPGDVLRRVWRIEQPVAGT